MTSAQVETERNDLVPRKGVLENQRIVCTAGEPQCAKALPFEQWGSQPEGSADRKEYNDVRAVLELDGTPEQIADVLKAVYWGEVPYADAVEYIKRGYGWQDAADRWSKNKGLGQYGVFSPEHTDNWTTYTVASGETLDALVRRTPGASMSDILALNRTIDPNALSPGQQLRVPTQSYLDEVARAKLEFVRLDRYLQASGGALPPGRAPAFAGEDAAVTALNAPREAVANAWIQANKREQAQAIVTARARSTSDGLIASAGNGPRFLSSSGPVNLGEFTRLNVPDPATGRLRPGEASAAVELQQALGGKLERSTRADEPDFVFASGPQTGKTVDFLFTPSSTMQADGINRYFDKNAARLPVTLKDHLGKADIVPIDSRFLTEKNRNTLMTIVSKLPKADQRRIVIFR